MDNKRTWDEDNSLGLFFFFWALLNTVSSVTYICWSLQSHGAAYTLLMQVNKLHRGLIGTKQQLIQHQQPQEVACCHCQTQTQTLGGLHCASDVQQTYWDVLSASRTSRWSLDRVLPGLFQLTPGGTVFSPQASLQTYWFCDKANDFHSLIHMKGTDNKNYNMGLKVAWWDVELQVCFFCLHFDTFEVKELYQC